MRVFAVSGLAIPGFWLGMLIILGLLAFFNWLPKIGYVSIFEDPITNLSALIWPALSVGYRYAAVATRMMRSALARGDARGLHPHRPRQGRVPEAGHRAGTP